MRTVRTRQALTQAASRPAADLRMWTALAAALLMLLGAPSARAQEEARPLIDVRHYEIEALVDPGSATLRARATVTYVPREETAALVFDLHNGLEVSKVETGGGDAVSAVRYRQDSTVRLTLPEAPLVDAETSLIFEYSGILNGYENSPVEGVDLATISPERIYLLYPARWFPVNGFEADQFSSTIRVTVPAGFTVLGAGVGSRKESANGVESTFEFSQPSFPGNIAAVREEPVMAERDGARMAVYFKTGSEDLARVYGEAAAEMMNFFTGRFGPPYSQNLVLVEAGEYAPEGYAGPGMVFLSPYGIRSSLNRPLLGRQVAHQWWRSIVSPGNRRHLWLDYGFAWYSALMEIQENEGQEAFDLRIQETRVESLTYTEIPVIESDRLAPFSPELRALAGAKGAMVLNMLRWVLGEEGFPQMMRRLTEEFAWKSIITDDVLEIAEQISGRDLQPFFLQWIEQTQTPEFSQEYTIYRLGQGRGFRVLGKVKQDMDTFQMPVELKIETEGEPEYRTIDVAGKASDYSVEAFGKPKRVVLDPNNRILRFDDDIRVKVAIRKGEQLVELGYYNEALQEYQRALDINRYSSLAHYRIAEVFFLQNNYQSAANEFRETLNGDQQPEWTIVWSHINLGKIFDVTGQRERAVNEYQLAIRTRDNTQNAQDEARKLLENPYRRPRRTERIY